MMWLCILIGYLFGNILFANIVSHIWAHKSAFELGGSNNPGMANVIRQIGLVPGLCVLAGDLLKCAAAVGVCSLFTSINALTILYCGLGCILGHDFCFWHHFKGGKGVSCTCAVLVLAHPLIGTMALIVGGSAVALSKKLWLGGILIPLFCVPLFWHISTSEGIITLIYTGLMIYSFRHDMFK